MKSKRQFLVISRHVSGTQHMDYYDDISKAFDRYFNVLTAFGWEAVLFEKVRGVWVEI